MAIQQIPLWKENENWRARQQAMRDQMDVLDQLNTNMTSANSDRASGIANLMTQAAIKRIQAEAQAKSAKAAAERAQANAEDRALEAIRDRISLYFDKTV